MFVRPNTKNLAGVIFFLGPILGVAGHALFSPNRIAYLSLGRSYRAPYVVQNDQNHHISGYGSRFQSVTTFRFRDICEKPLFESRNRQKIEIFAFGNFVILGVKIGFFKTAESIPGVHLALRPPVLHVCWTHSIFTLTTIYVDHAKSRIFSIY